ncbi:hypothetical protein T484DRAFT_1908303, partial [Baffinella frigidus]
GASAACLLLSTLGCSKSSTETTTSSTFRRRQRVEIPLDCSLDLLRIGRRCSQSSTSTRRTACLSRSTCFTCQRSRCGAPRARAKSQHGSVIVAGGSSCGVNTCTYTV